MRVNFLVLDRNTFEHVLEIDAFESLIWTDRYNSAGDFEIYLPMDSELFHRLPIKYYLWSPRSDRLMVIEQKSINTDLEMGDKLLISGPSLEGFILSSRIVWNLTMVKGSIQDCIFQLLNENAISPTDTTRRIPNFITQATTDQRILSITLDEQQYFGQTLLEIITDICVENQVGFRIVLDAQNRFVFSLYMGQDRSYEQEANLNVIFSPKYENLINSNYLESNQPYKSHTIVAGEGSGADQKKVYIGDASKSGLDRRELYTTASGVSSRVTDPETGETVDLPEEEYLALLVAYGAKELAKLENQYLKMFEGQVDTTETFILNRDFFLGDIVQVENAYGVGAPVRASEIIHSFDGDGEHIIPTFTPVEGETVI